MTTSPRSSPANLGVPSGQFLTMVRNALGRDDAPPPVAHLPLQDDLPALEAAAAALRARVAAELPALLDRMADTAALRGWQVARCPGVEDALDYIVALARRLGAASAACAEQPVFDAFPLDAALANAGVLCWPAVYNDADPAAVRRRLAESDLGITGADYAVAETGSVILLPRRGLSRLVSVVPPIHIAIVRPQDILGSLDDLFTLRRLEYHRHAGDMGSYLNFITGPSRTADIEQTIVVGVHGPRQAHLVLLEQE